MKMNSEPDAQAQRVPDLDHVRTKMMAQQIG
jgi:hypothetical protein